MHFFLLFCHFLFLFLLLLIQILSCKLHNCSLIRIFVLCDHMWSNDLGCPCRSLFCATLSYNIGSHHYLGTVTCCFSRLRFDRESSILLLVCLRWFLLDILQYLVRQFTDCCLNHVSVRSNPFICWARKTPATLALCLIVLILQIYLFDYHWLHLTIYSSSKRCHS